MNHPDKICVPGSGIKNHLTAARTIRYIDWDPQELLRPPTFYWNDATVFDEMTNDPCPACPLVKQVMGQVIGWRVHERSHVGPLGHRPR